jgi:hypothetical protein
MSLRPAGTALLLAALLAAVQPASVAQAVTLVDDPFIGSYNDWVDTYPGTAPVAGGLPDWRLHFFNETLMESSDGRAGDGATNAGDYQPYVIVQNGLTTPETYDLSARMYTSDDDLFGLVFGWQDNDNYFRVSLREQAAGNLGGTRGLAVQKVVGGIVTQISPIGVGEGHLGAPTQAMIDNREPIDVTVAVDGSNYSASVAGVNGGVPLVSGNDADLAPGKVGVLSWAQRTDTGTTPSWGVEVDSFTVTGATGGQLFHDTFSNFSPVAWRPLVMTNSAGDRLDETDEGDDLGNFGLDFRNRAIQDNSNGFEWATETTPNVDFLGPAIVVDEPGSESFSDYEMRVRLGNRDNDGLGVLVRVQDDDNFYRVTFSNEGIGTTGERAPAGLSVQKVSDGVWTELFRDDQNSPLFLYEPGNVTDVPAFDLRVRAVGNELAIEVIQDPDGAANVISYPLIVDTDDPLLTGTVGLHNWGSGAGAGGTYFTNYGGTPGPLLVRIPEPSTYVLLLIGACGLWALRRTTA